MHQRWRQHELIGLSWTVEVLMLGLGRVLILKWNTTYESGETGLYHMDLANLTFTFVEHCRPLIAVLWAHMHRSKGFGF